MLAWLKIRVILLIKAIVHVVQEKHWRLRVLRMEASSVFMEKQWIQNMRKIRTKI